MFASLAFRGVLAVALDAKPPGEGMESFQLRRAGEVSEEVWLEVPMIRSEYQ